MKKMLAIASLALSLPAVAKGVEFQTPGALGMGGAGVARDNGALTSYWNPAGAAFGNSNFALNAGAGVGIKASDGLTENIDRFSDIDFESVRDFNTANASSVGDLVKTLSIMNDIDARQGHIALNVVVPVSFSIKNISFGIYGNMEGYIQPDVDMVNILPYDKLAGVSTTLSVADLYTAASAGGVTYNKSGYFSDAQLGILKSKINLYDNNALTLSQQEQLAYAIDTQLKNSGIDPETALSTLTDNDKLLPTLASSGTNTLNKNTTSVMTKAVQYIEIPVSYGQPINVGKKGKLGLGVTGKFISGTVYQNQVLLVNRPGDTKVDASDLIDDITENKKTSTAIGIDLGALYKYDKWLSVGVVGKNLNSPKLDAPDYFDIQKSITVSGGSVELKPQVRAGVAVDPVGWVTLAADLDLTENDTLAPGTVIGSTSVKSRNFGGGFEVKPASWLKVRGGGYKNLAMSSSGNVLTAGFKLFMLDVDGAFATDTFTIDGNELPKEFKVNAAISFSF